MHLIISILLGALAGFIAGKIMDSEGGFLHNVVLGIVGGLVGGLLLGAFGITSYTWVGDVIVSVLGACIFIYLGRKLFH